MKSDAAKPLFIPENLILVTYNAGTFFDFALISGHPLITDFSRIGRDVVLKNGNISLGASKEKYTIDNIAELKNTFQQILSKVRQLRVGNFLIR